MRFNIKGTTVFTGFTHIETVKNNVMFFSVQLIHTRSPVPLESYAWTWKIHHIDFVVKIKGHFGSGSWITTVLERKYNNNYYSTECSLLAAFV